MRRLSAAPRYKTEVGELSTGLHCLRAINAMRIIRAVCAYVYTSARNSDTENYGIRLFKP
jgi:hypothetical protein